VLWWRWLWILLSSHMCGRVLWWIFTGISETNPLPPSLGLSRGDGGSTLLQKLENFYQTTRCHILDYTNLKEISTHYFFRYCLVNVKGYLVICLNKHTGSPGARTVWVVSATPPPLYHRERTGTHCIRVWMARRAQKMSLSMGLGARTVLSVACRYTDYAVTGASFFGTLWIYIVAWGGVVVKALRY
jgi:hypothetical protein